MQNTCPKRQVVHKLGCLPLNELRLSDQIYYWEKRLSTSVDSLLLICEQFVDGLVDSLSHSPPKIHSDSYNDPRFLSSGRLQRFRWSNTVVEKIFLIHSNQGRKMPGPYGHSRNPYCNLSRQRDKNSLLSLWRDRMWIRKLLNFHIHILHTSSIVNKLKRWYSVL